MNLEETKQFKNYVLEQLLSWGLVARDSDGCIDYDETAANSGAFSDELIAKFQIQILIPQKEDDQRN